MLSSARSTSHGVDVCRTMVFAGPHVQLDDLRYVSGFGHQVPSWTTVASTLIVMENGAAMASFPGSVPPVQSCAVFRFDSTAAMSVLSAAPCSGGAEPEFVQLSPQALFRYYWRRHALSLRYPCPDAHVEEDAKALLRHVISRARSGADLPGRQRRRALVAEASALLALAIDDPTPVARIARTLDTSPFHLARVFRSEVGMPPHQYLVQLRLIAALSRLRAGARDLSRLALEVGFCHHSHFTAVFREALGYTPRQVRRMLTATSIADLGIVARQSQVELPQVMVEMDVHERRPLQRLHGPKEEMRMPRACRGSGCEAIDRLL